MDEHQSFDKINLLMQLENYKLILEVNSDCPGLDQPLRERISQRIGMLETHLEKLDIETDYIHRALKEIKLLVEQMLN